jgi:tetratricopeptide (TPR) repeat protein
MLGNEFAEKGDPSAALAQTQIGNRELVRGNAAASQAAFCKAASWDGAKIERWLNLAQLFLVRRDARKAIESAERALALDAKNARALEITGDAWARLGQLTEARRAYLASEGRPEPDESTRQWMVRRDLDEAHRSARSRDFVRTERFFRRVVVFDPEHAGAARGVAMCLRKLDDPSGAEAWTRRAEVLERSGGEQRKPEVSIPNALRRRTR